MKFIFYIVLATIISVVISIDIKQAGRNVNDDGRSELERLSIDHAFKAEIAPNTDASISPRLAYPIFRQGSAN